MELQAFFEPLLCFRAGHDDPFHPGEFGHKPLLQALDQGHTGNMSAPAKPGRSDLDRVAFDAGELDITALALISQAFLFDNCLDFFYILFQAALR